MEQPFTETEVLKLARLRMQLEVLAAREMAEQARGDRAICESLSPIVREFKRAAWAQDHEGFHAADLRLHEALMVLSGVPRLKEVWAIVWEAFRWFHRTSLQAMWPDLRVLADEHVYLVDAILTGDAAAAEDAMRNHLDAVFFRLALQSGDGLQINDALQRTTTFLSTHLHRSLRLRDVASEIAFASPGHLSRLFRDHYGVSFQGYVQRLRMEKAADLLETTALPVALGARRVGYTDVSRFISHFKRHFGATPGRRRVKREAETGQPDNRH